MAALFLKYFAPLQQINPSHFHRFTPLQTKSYIILPPPPPPSRNYNLTLTSIYAHFQPYPFISLIPLNKLHSHSCLNLPLLAALFLHHFSPSQQINASPKSFYTPWQTNSHIITPLSRNYNLTFTSINAHFQPYPFIILIPLNKLHSHTYLNLPPLAAHFLIRYTIFETITHSFSTHFTPLGSRFSNDSNPSEQITPPPPLLNIPLSQANSYVILPPLNKLTLTLTPF